MQRSLSTLVFGGVLERFPELKIVSAENDTGWFPHFMYRMDHAYDKFHAMEKEPLPMQPSEYVKRQVWATFQDDPVGPATYKIFGEDNYMCGIGLSAHRLDVGRNPANGSRRTSTACRTT